MTEQEDNLLTELKRYQPSITRIANVYSDQYPPDTTPLEVVDAVTVPVPLRIFMVMAALCEQLVEDTAPAEEPTL